MVSLYDEPNLLVIHLKRFDATGLTSKVGQWSPRVTGLSQVMSSGSLTLAGGTRDKKTRDLSHPRLCTRCQLPLTRPPHSSQISRHVDFPQRLDLTPYLTRRPPPHAAPGSLPYYTLQV